MPESAWIRQEMNHTVVLFTIPCCCRSTQISTLSYARRSGYTEQWSRWHLEDRGSPTFWWSEFDYIKGSVLYVSINFYSHFLSTFCVFSWPPSILPCLELCPLEDLRKYSLEQCCAVLCCAVLSHSVVSNSLKPHGLWPARLLHPWGFSRQEY